jgi:hypothetical protein
MDALRSLDDVSKDRLLPHIVLPPLEAKDIEEKRQLSRDEFSIVQVGRLQRSWGKRPCLLDLRFLKFNKLDAGSDAARVSEFLSMARKFGCDVVPLIDSETDPYRLAAIAAHIQNTGSVGAIRLSLHDLQNEKLDELVATLLSSLRASASECLLILDFGEAAIGKVDDFSQFSAEWLVKLRDAQPWKRIILEASSYPTENPAPKNGRKLVTRDEWISWKKVVGADRSLLGWAQFGDYGADHGHVDFETGGRTVTHLRYATAEAWIVERGGKPLFLHDGRIAHDGTIQTVAKRLANDPEFRGELFSAGDEFISLCASREGGPGNSTSWRWANMVHHLTVAAVQCSELAGVPFKPAERVPVPKQISLLATGR